eukprot:2500991-Rhodomonas_salina.2
MRGAGGRDDGLRVLLEDWQLLVRCVRAPALLPRSAPARLFLTVDHVSRCADRWSRGRESCKFNHPPPGTASYAPPGYGALSPAFAFGPATCPRAPY